MLKRDTVRVREAGEKAIEPAFLRVDNKTLRQRADELAQLLSALVGAPRKEVDEALSVLVKAGGDLRINKGLVAAALSLAEFEERDCAPSQALRRALFEAAADRFPVGLTGTADRAQLLGEVGSRFGLAPAEVEATIFADLKEEQRLLRFDGGDGLTLLHRYNLELAQGVLLHALRLEVTLADGEPGRIRQLFRYLKFFRLLFRAELDGEDLKVTIDGPRSVLEQTRAYGVRLASFLPALLLLDRFKLVAELLWKRRRCTLTLTEQSGLVTHLRERGAWVPEELEQLRRRLGELLPRGCCPVEVPRLYSLGGREALVPDLVYAFGGREVSVEVIWPWRRVSWERFRELFLAHAPPGAFLCVASQATGSTGLSDPDPRIHLFRRTPRPQPLAEAMVQELTGHRRLLL